MKLCFVVAAALLLASVARAEVTELVGLDSDCTYLIPSTENGGSELEAAEWTSIAEPPNAEEWRAGKFGIGFAPENDPYYLIFLRQDVRAEMRGLSASLWARAEFVVDADALSNWHHLRKRDSP